MGSRPPLTGSGATGEYRESNCSWGIGVRTSTNVLLTGATCAAAFGVIGYIGEVHPLACYEGWQEPWGPDGLRDALGAWHALGGALVGISVAALSILLKPSRRTPSFWPAFAIATVATAAILSPVALPFMHVGSSTSAVFPDTADMRERLNSTDPDGFEIETYIVPLRESVARCAPELKTGTYLVFLDYDVEPSGRAHPKNIWDTKKGAIAPPHLLQCISRYVKNPSHVLSFRPSANRLQAGLGTYFDFPIRNSPIRKLAITNGWDPTSVTD